MMQKGDGIDAMTELYALGKEAEVLIGMLAEAQERATYYRVHAMPGNAQFESTEAVLLEIELGQIGEQQKAIIAQLRAAGEVIYL